MDLHEKIRTLPTQPGVYLYINAEGEVIYVGKAKNLRSRVRSYLLEASQANAKTGSLMREAVDLDYILVANEHEALALENNLIKQKKPRFNILLRDDKTYPYVKLTLGDRFPKVFVTRRLRKDGSAYYGPYFPGNLAYRVVELIHRSFLLPSCKVDLNRYHPRACLQYYIHRCLGPCVEGLTSPEAYRDAVRDAQLFLEGKQAELERNLTQRMMVAAEAQQFEAAARLRDQLSTVHQLQEKQRIATVEQDDDADVFGYHFEAGALAVNLFHVRNGKIVDRREFFWEDLPDLLEASDEEHDPQIGSVILSINRTLNGVKGKGVEGSAVTFQSSGAPGLPVLETWDTTNLNSPFNPGQVFSALLKQLYIDQPYVPRSILVPVDFPDRESLAALLTQRVGHRIELAVPQRGEKRSLVDLAAQNAKQSYTQRFRVLEPSRKAIQEAVADALMLPELPRRIECFDISHIQGAETVASLVVWEDGKMNKSAYRKFKVMTVLGVDDFASMREVVHRRYKRILENSRKDNPPGEVILGAPGLPVLETWETTEAMGAPSIPAASSPEWVGSHEPQSAAVVKGHDFSRAENPSATDPALAPEGRPSKEPTSLPSLILIDGGLGQLHAAADALESLGLTTQPLASIAKKEEVIYLYGNEDEPVVLDRRSPVLHLIQMIRDESHRFAVGYHRQRRSMRDRDSELLNIPGVGALTRQRLLAHFGSLRDVQQATAESLAAVVPKKTADSIWRHFHEAAGDLNPFRKSQEILAIIAAAMQFEYRLTSKDFLAAQVLHAKRNMFTRIARAVGFYVVPILGALMWVYVLFTAIAKHWARFDWSIFVVGAVWMAIPLYWRWAMRRLYRRTMSESGNSRLDLDSNLIRCKGPHSKGEIEWEAVRGTAEDGKTFLLYLAPGKFLVIPKRVCSPEHVEELRQLCKSRITPR